MIKRLQEIRDAFKWTWDNMGTEHTSDHFNVPANGINDLERLIEETESPQPFPGIEERAKELWPDDTEEGNYDSEEQWLSHRKYMTSQRDMLIEFATEATEQLRVENEKAHKRNELLQNDIMELIADRDHWEERVDKIADALGDQTEWSNLNDRYDNSIEIIASLQQQLTQAKEALSDAVRDWGIGGNPHRCPSYNAAKAILNPIKITQHDTSK